MGREQLRTEIQLGIEQLDRGESSDEESVFAEIDAAIAWEMDHCSSLPANLANER